MKPFLKDEHCSDRQLKRYVRWVKKMEKFEAFLEVVEIKPSKLYPSQAWSVELFCPKIHIDRLGNMAIMKGYHGS